MKTCKSCEHHHTVCYCSWCAKDKVWVRIRTDKPACREYRMADRILRKIAIGIIAIFSAIIMIIAAVTYHKNRYAVVLPPETKYEQQTKRSAALAMYPLKTHDSFTVFELVEKITGVDERILRGYAYTEGRFCLHAVGDGGRSLGMMQINETYRDKRIKLCGYEYDPFDEFDAVYLAALVIKENQKEFPNNPDMWITAYCRGVGGVRKHGPIGWYVESVRRYL